MLSIKCLVSSISSPKFYLLLPISSRSLFCCARPSVERDLSPPSVELEVPVGILTPVTDNKSPDKYQGASQEKIVSAFRKFDKNGDGVIDWEEFQQVRARPGDRNDIGGSGLLYCGPGTAEEDI